MLKNSVFDMSYVQLATIVAAAFLAIFSVLSRRAKARQYAELRAELARSSELVCSIREELGSTIRDSSNENSVLAPIEKQLQEFVDANARLKGGVEAWIAPIDLYAAHTPHKHLQAYWKIFASTYPVLDRRKPSRDLYRAVSPFPRQTPDPDDWYEDSEYLGGDVNTERRVTLH